MRNRFSLIAALSSAVLFLAVQAPFAAAQINIAAIAQFKYNQQHALAASLAKTQDTGSKHSRQKGEKAAVAVRPPVIHAHNPTFKGNYGDMHTKNVR